LSEEAKPARKIKPPSASFLKSREVSPSAEGIPAVSEVKESPSGPATDSQEGLLGAPSLEDLPDDDLFSGPPEPVVDEAQAVPSVDVAVAEAPAGVAPSPVGEAGIAERLAAELRELRDIVNAVESLQYLRARVGRAVEEGADALTLVSFYRLVVRSLSEGSEQSRRDFELMRSKASKLELELATSLAQGGAPSASAPSGEVPSNVQERLRQLEQEAIQMNEQREKLLLDFKHMRERTQKDLDIRLFREKEKFFKSFLPVLDSFERAQQSLNENSSVTALLEGFRLIGNQLMEALATEGLEPVETECHFDPRFHEAVGEVENEDKPDDYIYDELSRGYRLGERLIRPAMVRLSRNPKGVLPRPSEPSPVEAEE